MLQRLSLKTICQQMIRVKFCSQKPQVNPQNKKSYYMPDKENYNDSHDYFGTKRPYINSKPIHFKNGRHLLYLNKQHLWTPYIYSSYLTLPFLYIAYLIKNNPFYLTFPAALPLMFIIQGVLILRWVSLKAHFKNQIQRIYLLETGEHIEFCYSNKIKRYLKDNQMMKPIIIGFFDTKYDPENAENIQPIRGTRFPKNLKQVQENTPYFWQYGWTKRDKYFNTYIIPAKNYQYANWDLLLATMNGQSVDLTDCTHEGSLAADNCPTVQQELENLKKLNNKNQQDKPQEKQ